MARQPLDRVGLDAARAASHQDDDEVGVERAAAFERGAFAVDCRHRVLQVKDNAVILRAGEQIASWNLQNTTRIDAKQLREEAPEIFGKFSKTTPSRVLRFKKPKEQ